MKLEILVLRVFLEHFNQTLHSHHLIFFVCIFLFMFHTTGTQIGDSGAESIARALQSNTSLTSLDISGVCCVIHMFHTTDNQIGYSGAESISRALQSNTSLTSLDIFRVYFFYSCFTQQVTKLEILVLRVLREHFSQTLHSHHLIFRVCCFVQASFTQQVTKLEILVLRSFREHFNQTLHSNHLIFHVCYFIKIPFTQ